MTPWRVSVPEWCVGLTVSGRACRLVNVYYLEQHGNGQAAAGEGWPLGAVAGTLPRPRSTGRWARAGLVRASGLRRCPSHAIVVEKVTRDVCAGLERLNVVGNLQYAIG